MRLLMICLALLICMSASAQKNLTTSQIKNIPVWTSTGLERDYTRTEILSFIVQSNWSPKYAKKGFVEYFIQQGSDALINQYFIETRASCKQILLEKKFFESSYTATVINYGAISKEEFSKYCFILTLLASIDTAASS